MNTCHASAPLARYLAVSYVLLVISVTLYPMSGWHVVDASPLAFLDKPFAHRFRLDDAIANVLGYIPLGFVLTAALPVGRWRSALAAVLLSGLLSLLLETTQTYLPARVASTADLACNLTGALIGALLAASVGRNLLASHGALQRWRERHLVSGSTSEWGLVLIGLWLLTQFLPNDAVLATGNLRSLSNTLPSGLPLTGLPMPHAIQVTLAILGIGLFASTLRRSSVMWPILVLIALGLGAKSLASWAFLVPGHALAWLTPQVFYGLAIGLPLLGLALCLPDTQRKWLAMIALTICALLTSLLPDTLYEVFDQRLLTRGNFINFDGPTRLLASIWPALALGYLLASGQQRQRHAFLAG